MDNKLNITIPMTRERSEIYDKMTAAVSDSVVKSVSFSLFGTLLIFPFSEDNDLFLLMERELPEISVNGKGFADLRVEAEVAAEGKFKEKCSASLEQIYDILAKKAKLTKETAASLKERECVLAEKYVFARHFGKRLFDIASEREKNIVLIADTVYPREVVLRMAEKCGICGKILITNEIDSSENNDKTIFETILKKGKSSAAAHLHIGGDIKKDVETPILNGARALLLTDTTANMIKSGRTRGFAQSENIYDYDTAEFLALHLAFGIYSAYIFDIPWNKTALSDFCGNPYILGFFVYGCGMKSDISRLDDKERTIFDALSENPDCNRGGSDFCELFRLHFGDVEASLQFNGFQLPLKMLAEHGGSVDMELLKNYMSAEALSRWRREVTDAPAAPKILSGREQNGLEKIADKMFPPGTKVRNIADGILFKMKKKR